MKQTALVLELSDDKKTAVVEVARKSMCDGCHKKGCGDSCAMYTIFGGSDTFKSYASNEIGAETGDLVTVETEDKKVLKYSFFVFFLPVLISVLAYLFFNSFYSDSVSVLGCVILFLLYFIILAFTERFRKKRKNGVFISEIKNKNSGKTV